MDAASISVISADANCLSAWPSNTASHPTLARQTKTIASRLVVAIAAGRLQRAPRAPITPHRIEIAPKVPPDMSAVFAFSGLERKPANPMRMRKQP